MTHISTKTVAALLTPAAPGAIAVIALAGGATREILTTIARRSSADMSPAWLDRRPTLCRIVDGQDIVDDAIVILIDHDDQILGEIHLHGGVRITQRVLMLLERLGAAVVSAADFPHLLRPNDPIVQRIDAAIESAASRKLVRWLLAQRDLLPSFIRTLNSRPPIEREAFNQRSPAAARLINGLNIAIVGPPNAGKSTPANRLIGTDRVITSDIPGTTRDWISETALIDGWPVTLIDTAGIRETSCDVEAEAVRRGGEQARISDLILLVTDATDPADLQGSAMRSIRDSMSVGSPMIHVANKCDKAIGELPPPTKAHLYCRISALTGHGISELERQICKALGFDLLDESLPAAFFDLDEGGPA